MVSDVKDRLKLKCRKFHFFTPDLDFIGEHDVT